MPKEQKKSEADSGEKIVTKYDLKMQRRKEEKEREERAKRVSSGVTIVVLLALVCLVLSFPIRTYISLHKTLFTVGDEKIGQVEFDYSFYTVVNNYVSSYSSYLSMFGLDLSKDLSTQMYSGTMSWQDYFEETTVENLRRSKAMKADANANGFLFDTSKEYETIVAQLKSGAQEQGLSLNKYLQQMFGPYANLSRIKPYIEEAIYVNEYYSKLSDDMTPSKEEVEAKYTEDPQSYDSIDYRILSFDATLPEEPTELALPEEEREYTESADGTQTYQPSDAEVEKAMADAKALADEALSKVKTEGEEVKGLLYASTNTVIRDWLFDASRKAGNTTVLEDTSLNRYYVVAFEKRYRDETPTVNARVLVADTEEEAQEIYNEWQNGGGTEPYFEELCDGKYAAKSVAEGGLLEGLTQTEDLYEELTDWLFAEERKVGDCDIINIENVACFIVYYSGEGDPKWYNTIKSDLLSAALSDYVNALKEKCQVQDPNGVLNYLKIRAAEEEAAAASDAAASIESQSEETLENYEESGSESGN